MFVGVGSVLCALGAALLTSNSAVAGGNQDKLNGASLKTMIEGLGYETKALNEEAGKEKYEFKINKAGFDIPIAAEVSPSTNYVWLTVFLGAVKPTHKFEELLKQNTKIQPSQFYITSKGSLMVGIALDNRQINPAVLRRNIDKVSEDVSGSSTLWSGQ